jgi:hypothetical protein
VTCGDNRGRMMVARRVGGSLRCQYHEAAEIEPLLVLCRMLFERPQSNRRLLKSGSEPPR